MDFNKALDGKIEDVERPLNVPQGTYDSMISKPAIYGVISSPNFNAETITFPIALLNANTSADDIDEDDLAAFGDLKAAFIEHKFLFNSDDDAAFQRTHFQIKQFLENTMQIDLKGKSLKEAISETMNQPLIVAVSWRPDKNDPNIFYTQVKSTAPAE